MMKLYYLASCIAQFSMAFYVTFGVAGVGEWGWWTARENESKNKNKRSIYKYCLHKSIIIWNFSSRSWSSGAESDCVVIVVVMMAVMIVYGASKMDGVQYHRHDLHIVSLQDWRMKSFFFLILMLPHTFILYTCT